MLLQKKFSALKRGALELQNQIKGPDAEALSRYDSRDGIVLFVHEVLGVEEIAPYQIDILHAFYEVRKVAVRAVHGAGKTAIASWCILWVLAIHTGDVKVPCTATTKTQLYEFLFPEVRKWALRANWSLLGLTVRDGRELLMRSLTIGGSRRAFTVASDKPTNVEGAHGDTIAYVYDEAKGIPDAMFDATHGAFSTGIAFALAISTPGELSGRFYDIHQGKPGTESWWTRHITIEEAIAAGRVTEEWVEESKALWGEHSAEFKRRVLGNFAGDEDNTVIALEWFESAVARLKAAVRPLRGEITLGVDPATTGKNMTAIAPLIGDVVPWLEYVQVDDPMSTAGRVINHLRALAPDDPDDEEFDVEEWIRQVPIGVDANGVGAGVHKRLEEQGYAALAMMAGAGTDLTDHSGVLHFANWRSALYWSVRDMLNPAYGATLALPDDDRLKHDLTAARFRTRSDGKIIVESKADIAKRLNGRSTDGGDAVMLALFARLQGMVQLWTQTEEELLDDEEFGEFYEEPEDDDGWITTAWG